MKHFTITCDGNWTITNVPEWLDITPAAGKKTQAIELKTIADNDTDVDRHATLIVKHRKVEMAVEVIQKCGLATGCDVRPNSITVLSNGIAFDLEFGPDVAYYYRGYMTAKSVNLMSEAEIIKVLEEEFQRKVVDRNVVAVFDDLQEGTDYVIYTLGYNNAGKRGKLNKKAVSTPITINNEPQAWIGDMKCDNSSWYWTITKSATCNSYYMMSSENESVAFASDVMQAFWIDEAIRNNDISEYVNGGSWQSPRYRNVFGVWTRGLDKQGRMSNVISWLGGSLNSSNARIREKAKTNTQHDYDSHKLEAGTCKFYRVN